jgi:hypothetical protein
VSDVFEGTATRSGDQAMEAHPPQRRLECQLDFLIVLYN